MMIVGEPIYKTCETRNSKTGLTISVPCFIWRGNDALASWCRPCLLAKIQSLQDGLARVAEVVDRERQS